MEQQQSNIKERTKIRINKPRKFEVLMLNDDVTTFDFVIDVIISVFGKDQAEAERLTWKIHNEGSAVMGTYSRDIAVTKAAEVHRRAERNNFPLRVVIRPA